VKYYAEYRSQVREDFEERCAYCLLHEDWAAGEDGFHLDHFRPRGLFPHLENDFYNLYYACYPCNKWKWQHWPSQELERVGICFVDLCKDDFNKHFELTADGKLLPVSPAGEYTTKIIRLNRVHLVRVRALMSELNRRVMTQNTSFR